MTARAARHRGHAVGHFGLVFVRPPVPGENGKSDTVRPESYEPEGRASSDHTHPSWAESFQAVLDDQDGICLFRDFLTQEGCTDLIDFWLACRGFQLARYAPLGCSSTWTDVLNKRRLKLAKAIYRKYIINNGVVGNKLRTVTKISLGERVRRAQLDSALFLQAKQEVQDAMELEVFPVFLKSHVFLTYAQQTCTEQETDIWNINSHKQETENDQQEVLKFLPDLGEKREWVESEGASANHKRPEHGEAGYKLKHRQCVKADAHEISSHHEVRMRRIPRDVHAEPHKFAADLISRLEMVQRESENWRRVEEHLHPVNMHPEGNVAEVFPASSLCPTHHFPAHRGSSHCDAHAENPDILLDRRKCVCERVTVVYHFCGEPIPYRTVFRGRVVTLADFTQLLSKKGSYRFFFKKASDEFDCGVVYEEVCEDDAVLPEFQGKIIGKVEKI